MKFNYRLLVGAAALIALAGACSKKYKQPDTVEPNVVNPFGGPPGSVTPGSQLNKLFKDLRSVPETQCVTAGVLQVVQFKKGTILTFYPNSFKDKTGKIITEGTVCLDVVEMYNPGSMIANRATTETNEGILSSGGQVQIKATKDGQEVFANTYGIAFTQLEASSKPMQLFYGNSNNSDSVTKWVLSDTTQSGTVAYETVVDTPSLTPTPTVPSPPPVPPAPRYDFSSAIKFGLVNCDRFWEYPRTNRTTVLVELPDDSYGGYNTEVFVIFPEVKSVISGENLWDAPKKYRVGYENYDALQVPIGLKASVICITNKNDTYYYYEQADITIAKDMVITATPEAKSPDFIKARLEEL